MNKSKINSLLIEDNLSSQEMVIATLADICEVTALDRGRNAIDFLKKQVFDLVILDVGLPDIDGFQVCTLIRNDPVLNRIPIILLTGRDHDADRIMGLTLGADDYITKPFNPGEFRARVLALIRRSVLSGVSEAKKVNNNLSVGDLRLSTETQRAFVNENGNDLVINLTTIEFKILKLLMTSVDRVFSRNEIIDLVWGHSTFITERTVDTHMSNLRKKLKSAGELIRSVHGSGYRLSPSE